jgi:CopG family nickel-responsive transcriptional regulator
MQRVTITVDETLMDDLDRLIALRGYQNRSEAIRDLARAGLRQAMHEAAPDRACVAALVYVYDHATRDLPKRLARGFHGHHDMAVSTLHIHLDHESCMEVTVLKGKAGDVRHVADHVIAERGIKHGQLVTVPVELVSEKHPHGGESNRRHQHAHVR